MTLAQHHPLLVSNTGFSTDMIPRRLSSYNFGSKLRRLPTSIFAAAAYTVTGVLVVMAVQAALAIGESRPLW